MYNSHGVISYKIQNNQILFLLSQRRDSLNFIKVLRNLHRLQKDEYESMMANITPDEIERVRGYDFDPVWEDLYIVKTNKVYITERHRARQNYKEFKSFVDDENGNCILLSLKQYCSPSGNIINSLVTPKYLGYEKVVLNLDKTFVGDEPITNE